MTLLVTSVFSVLTTMFYRRTKHSFVYKRK